ncbi:hypothetical protein [Paenarthrobacter nitroguajacolicus]|uniref:hypothetical protein n=1 Tax=Paenarthrobacter nitroguajacolicus TaxID=211146 RepID=UPI00405445EA
MTTESMDLPGPNKSTSVRMASAVGATMPAYCTVREAGPMPAGTSLRIPAQLGSCRASAKLAKLV